MAQEKLSVQLTVKEIHDVLCPKCKKALRQLVKDKITDNMVTKVIGNEE